MSELKPRLTDIFVNRPVLAVVLCVALILIGVRAALNIPVLQYPKIESATMVISTPYIGASAEIVQGYVSDPIERAASSVPGVDFVHSITTAGFSTVTVALNLNEKSTDALSELNTRLAQIRFELPAGAEDPSVQVFKADRQDMAGWYLDVKIPETMTRAELSDYLVRQVNPELANIKDVQKVSFEGGRLPAMRIWLDPHRIAMYNLTIGEIQSALVSNNIIATIGRSENADQRIDLMIDTTLTSAAEFEQLVIRDSEGAVVRLADIADVELGEEEGTMTARFNEHEVVYVAVYPVPGADEIAIADELYKRLDTLNASLEHGIELGVGYDVTVYMRAALREIAITLLETVLLVGLVVVALMGSFRTAMVPLITIPISLLGAIAAMSLMGFSLNILTVLAIVLSVGLVVDDAIVVVENVARLMREGHSRYQAALISSRQLFSPIIGMTLTLATVYAPIGFLGGLTGFLFAEFAFSLAVAVLISGVVALTLSPIMSSRVCPENGDEGTFTVRVNAGFDRLRERYRKILSVTLNRTPQVLYVAILTTLLAVPFYLMSAKELAPVEDQNSIMMISSAAPESSPEYTQRYTTDMIEISRALPGATDSWQLLMTSGGFAGQDFVELKDRDNSIDELNTMAMFALSELTGMQAFPVLSPALPTAGQFDVEVVIQSNDTAMQMLPYADQLVEAMVNSGLFLYAETDLQIDLPQGQMTIDRNKVADLGMTIADVSSQISFLLSGNYVNRFNYEGKAYRVVPMLRDEDRNNPNTIMQLQINTPSGIRIPLSEVATVEQHPAPRFLSRFAQKNAFKVYGGVIPMVATKEQALSMVEQAAQDILPAGYTVDYAGESRQLRQEGNTLLGVLGMALVFVYFVLAIQFNSLRDPLVVLLGSVPLAISGALMFSFLGLTSVNIYAQVGLITLVGLVAKNGILMVEFANQQQMLGYNKHDAIVEAAVSRLRPILMTTAATVLGHFPLVLVTGAGAEARNSIGIILVAGMLVGTMFTLVVLPTIYRLLASNHQPNPEAELKVA